MTTPSYPDSPDYVILWQRFNSMTPGHQAELRHVAEPEDLRLKPALYRLFAGTRPDKRHLRIAFVLPWAEHRANAESFGSLCAKEKINEARLFQIIRGNDPADLVQLRRIIMQIKPQINWTQFGKLLWSWPYVKREIIEDYYLAQYAHKGTHKGSQP